jgi:para-nitrobenzyl esterase
MSMSMAQTNYGAVKGVLKQGYTVFRGIPYAKPPIGEYRWRAPEAPNAWDGVLEASAWDSSCMRRLSEPGSFYEKEGHSDGDFSPPMSENGLFLNIWTPADIPGKKYPVAFWIHGGGFTSCHGSEMVIDGAEYCKRDIILVSINYRLGALGFFAHESLSKESKQNVSGNYGILDAIAALQWVHENIAAFGGNPEHVTIFGQSAGCRIVQTLIISPLAKNLFSRAILQSGVSCTRKEDRFQTFDMLVKYGDWINTLPDEERTGAEFMKFCNVSTLAGLRGFSSEEIHTLSNEFITCSGNNNLVKPFWPCIDGVVMPAGYEESVEHGLLPNVRCMIGSTENDEGMTEDMLKKGVRGNLFYKRNIDWSLTCERLWNNPSFVYYFTHKPLGDDAGAFHSSELWYMFGTLHRNWRPKIWADYELSKKMLDYWGNFIKTGDPNGEGLEYWKPCDKKDTYVHELA